MFRFNVYSKDYKGFIRLKKVLFSSPKDHQYTFTLFNARDDKHNDVKFTRKHTETYVGQLAVPIYYYINVSSLNNIHIAFLFQYEKIILEISIFCLYCWIKVAYGSAIMFFKSYFIRPPYAFVPAPIYHFSFRDKITDIRIIITTSFFLYI